MLVGLWSLRKSWFDTVPNNKDWNGDEILLAWETVISWNQDNPYDEISLGFKFTPEEKGNTVELKEEKRSREISQEVKDKVWNRDGGKCVQCDSNEDLEFDHIIPHSKGGANTYRNIQLLCEPCNRSKSAKIG